MPNTQSVLGGTAHLTALTKRFNYFLAGLGKKHSWCQHGRLFARHECTSVSGGLFEQVQARQPHRDVLCSQIDQIVGMAGITCQPTASTCRIYQHGGRALRSHLVEDGIADPEIILS